MLCKCPCLRGGVLALPGRPALVLNVCQLCSINKQLQVLRSDKG